jgi:hypothetical protein
VKGESEAFVASYRFVYDVVRHVDNCRIEGGLLLGFEVRRGGRFSQTAKRYRLSKITTAERIVLQRRRPFVPRVDRFA